MIKYLDLEMGVKCQKKTHLKHIAKSMKNWEK